MYEVKVAFTDQTTQSFHPVKSVKVNQTDYELHFESGTVTMLPKANIFTFTYKKVS